ncbi:hypothetical protein J3A83DRAFT_3163060 [Scleroderma citrinum]
MKSTPKGERSNAMLGIVPVCGKQTSSVVDSVPNMGYLFSKRPNLGTLHRNQLKLFLLFFGNWDKYSAWNPRNSIYFGRKHYRKLSGGDDEKAEVYTAWYFIIAHEIAHNKAHFHDEDHELLLTCIAQRWFTPLRKLLVKVAPGAC